MKVTCPICNSNNQKIIWHNKVWGGKKNDKFLHCKKCDIVFLNPFPNSKKVKAFYESDFGTYMKQRSSKVNWNDLKKQYRDLYKREIPLRSKYINRYLKKGSVCDVGCSTGFTLDFIKNNKKNKTYGVEPSSEHVKFINKKHTIFKDLNEINIQFDNIIHYYVLEHVYDPILFLNNCLLKLKKNGRMIFEIPHRNDALFSLYQLNNYKDFIMQKMHLFYFSEKSIKFILDKFNIKYNIFKCQRYDFNNHINWLSRNNNSFEENFFTNKINNLYKDEIIKKNYNDHFTITLTKL